MSGRLDGITMEQVGGQAAEDRRCAAASLRLTAMALAVGNHDSASSAAGARCRPEQSCPALNARPISDESRVLCQRGSASGTHAHG